MAVLPVADELLRPQALERMLHLREDQLNRVPLRAVGHVPDPPEAELLHFALCVVVLVRAGSFGLMLFRVSQLA